MAAETFDAPSPGAHDPSNSLPPCLYCGGREYRLLFDRVRDRLGHLAGDWQFWRCGGCGSATLAPFPRTEDLAGFYPAVYGFNLGLAKAGRLKRLLNRAEYALFFRPQYRAQARAVLRGTGGPRAGGRLLDIGCGQGLRLEAFRRRGFEVTGTDLQPEVVEGVRRRLGVEAVCAEVSDLPRLFPPSSFDLITAFFLLEHVPDVGAVLRDCRALLRPGGWLVAAVPLLDSVQARLLGARWINVTEAPRHLSLPTRAGLRGLFGRHGYEAITLRPDSVLSCAGSVGLSVFPGAALTHAYAGAGRAGAFARRLAGGAVALAAVPGCLFENYVLRRPGLGVVFARRPAGGG